jgi:hypothetical protein
MINEEEDQKIYRKAYSRYRGLLKVLKSYNPERIIDLILRLEVDEPTTDINTYKPIVIEEKENVSNT